MTGQPGQAAPETGIRRLPPGREPEEAGQRIRVSRRGPGRLGLTAGHPRMWGGAGYQAKGTGKMPAFPAFGQAEWPTRPSGTVEASRGAPATGQNHAGPARRETLPTSPAMGMAHFPASSWRRQGRHGGDVQTARTPLFRLESRPEGFFDRQTRLPHITRLKILLLTAAARGRRHRP